MLLYSIMVTHFNAIDEFGMSWLKRDPKDDRKNNNNKNNDTKGCNANGKQNVMIENNDDSK